MNHMQALMAYLDRLAVLPERERAERRAQCQLLGHESVGEVYLTTIPTHVCRHCLMRYQIGGGFGYIE